MVAIHAVLARGDRSMLRNAKPPCSEECASLVTRLLKAVLDEEG
jgi:hypothetical protein